MDGYRFALVLHLFALMAASGTTATLFLAQSRYRRSATVGEAKSWHALSGSIARVFPVALITLLASGAYMTSRMGGWRLGWVQGGLTGVLLLMAVGVVNGARGIRLAAELDRISGRPAPLPWDTLAGVLHWVATCISASVVAIMATKPSLVASLSVLAVGIAIGASLGLARARAIAEVSTQVEG